MLSDDIPGDASPPNEDRPYERILLREFTPVEPLEPIDDKKNQNHV